MIAHKTPLPNDHPLIIWDKHPVFNLIDSEEILRILEAQGSDEDRLLKGEKFQD
jgi:hypothetical protein